MTKNMTLITIQGVGEEVKKMICDALSKFFNVQQEQLNEIVVSANNFSMLEAEEYTNCENHALVIDGPSLQFALESECSKLFTELVF